MSTQSPDDKISSPPPGRWRTVISILIIVYLVWQIALPLSYYAGFREGIYDERFSWRMFSNVGLRECEVEVVEHRVHSHREFSRKLNLRGILYYGWISRMDKNVTGAQKKFLLRRCTEGPDSVRSVELIRSCKSVTGKALTPQRTVLDCRTVEFTEYGMQ